MSVLPKSSSYQKNSTVTFWILLSNVLCEIPSDLLKLDYAVCVEKYATSSGIGKITVNFVLSQ